jgi:hypothetical protein
MKHKCLHNTIILFYFMPSGTSILNGRSAHIVHMIRGKILTAEFIGKIVIWSTCNSTQIIDIHAYCLVIVCLPLSVSHAHALKNSGV